MREFRVMSLAFALGPAWVQGHGSMYEPPARNSNGMRLLAPTCAGGACEWYSQGCSIGCPTASQKFSPEPDCPNPAEPKLKFGQDDDLLQFETDGHGTNTTYFPWRYPGAAPLLDSCGVTGGGFPPYGQVDPPPGVPAGIRGSDEDYAPKLLEQTVWKAGSVVEVAWSMAANHGGGYQYRLCPSGEALTEECFQRNPLEFVGDDQWIQFGRGYDVSTRRKIRAQRIGGDKVMPENSTWTRNPIPGCIVDGARDRKPCRGPLFDPPLDDTTWKYAGGSVPGIYGYGGGHCMGNLSQDPTRKCTDDEYGNASFDFGVVDKVRVPANLEPGEYVISFRWDCEQTKQIWSSCGDVTVVASGPSTKPFSPQKGCTPCCAKAGICSNCSACLFNRRGDCEYCWKPLLWWGGMPHWSPRARNVQCLGFESADGGAADYSPGDSVEIPWSPGCTKCWAEKDGCAMHVRELEEVPVNPDPVNPADPDKPDVSSGFIVSHVVAAALVVVIILLGACTLGMKGTQARAARASAQMEMADMGAGQVAES